TEDSPRADDESIVILVPLSVLFYPQQIFNEFTFLTISKNNLKNKFLIIKAKYSVRTLLLTNQFQMKNNFFL
ncbi:MAG: hypothetical protein QOK67_10140, partial [Nitrososphaeraceae archaeon]|nr:hypothetical protein [Nitrososphaeraceae archaeon]